MAKTYYYTVDGYLKDMSAQRLREIFGYSGGNEVSKAVLLRTIIMNEKEQSPVSYDRTQRRFWYFTVKPILEKLGQIKEGSEEGGMDLWNQSLSVYIAELFREGYLTYQDLHIKDISRVRNVSEDRYVVTDLGTYGYKIGIGAYPNIVIATEKDSGYDDIKGIAEFFGFSSISGKGEGSLAAMEDMITRIHSISSIKNDAVVIYFLSITDYDPAGYWIAETFAEQAQDVVDRFSLESTRIERERVGVYPSQLTHDEIDNNKYTPKPKGLAKWLKETGGINGEGKGLELDALTPDRVREVFVTSIRNGGYVDPFLYVDFVKDSFIRKKILGILEPIIADIIEDVKKEIGDGVDMSGVDIFDVAMDGYNHIPVSEICSMDEDEIIKATYAKCKERVKRARRPLLQYEGKY